MYELKEKKNRVAGMRLTLLFTGRDVKAKAYVYFGGAA